ncbi:hypothetical protein [Paenibacillus sp. V4I7]|uniref:hypothetical protein n=1 Tax=Paenibacillus sp. V4I7 TaxID=3042307 RepID=UPI0027896729|nr:hypothetical protein [Paenibacillus sp. V4I7]MDQ0899432.1 hypothetical protein [Paenibacillus sp. V4I7]
MTKRYIIIVTIGVMVLVSGCGIKNDNSVSIPSINWDSNTVYATTIDKIGEYADAVVVAEPIKDIFDSQAVVKYFPKDPGDNSGKSPAIEDFYTITELKVDKVLKKSTVTLSLAESDVIKVYEPIAVIDTKEGKKLLKQDEYNELKKDKKYVINLKKSDTGEIYGIVRDNDGITEVNNDLDIENAKKKYKL